MHSNAVFKKIQTHREVKRMFLKFVQKRKLSTGIFLEIVLVPSLYCHNYFFQIFSTLYIGGVT